MNNRTSHLELTAKIKPFTGVNAFQNLLEENSVITMPSHIYFSQNSIRFPYSANFHLK